MNVGTTPNLTEQIAIITGSGSGIGRVTALALAAAGATVVVVDRATGDTAAAIETAGGRAVAKTVDVTDQHAVEQMVSEVEQQFGAVDLLMNNAGIGVESIGATWEVDPDWWWRTIDVNLHGQFLCVRAVLPGMVRRRQGRIVNVSSGVAYKDIAGLSAYCASKAAVARFTGCLADETRDYRVAVFVITPHHLVRTPLTEAVAASDAPGQTVSRDFTASFDNFAANLEKGALELPEPSARLVVQLASGKADALSGRYIGTSDDLDELIRRADEITRDDLYTLQRSEFKREAAPR